MSKKRKRISNWPRLILQWGVILYIIILALRGIFKDSVTTDFEAYCPFGGLQAIGSFLLNNSLACTMTSTQMIMGALLLIGVFIFSKLFCAYICPIGTISEWLGKLGAKLKIRITIKGVADKALRSLKYILLFITIYFTFKSNELFCKEYDPFYAIVSGYDSDVKALFATIAIAITVLGAIFVRLFWCKYLCPLGAISNIFKFGVFFAGVMAVYLILLVLDVELSFVWPLAAACLGGYIIELIGQKSGIFPLSKITRNESTCTSCQLCSIKCPQAIDVASMKVVKHVDCNLCSECLTVCPEKETLQINHRKGLKWMPIIAVTLLFVIGLALQSSWEVPTINQKWGTDEEISKAEVYSREGLKNIKCYGSSVSFANKMQQVKGVYGVATYVGSHKVDILYDTSIISEVELERTIFTPNKTLLRTLKKGNENVTEVTVYLENFFDAFDFSYLSRMLKQETDAIAVLSEYGCPIIVKIYFPGGIQVDQKELKEVLESEKLSYEVSGKVTEVELNFEQVGKAELRDISKAEYVKVMFSPYERNFNDFEKYDSTVLGILTLPMGKNRSVSNRLPYLTSHLSNNDGVVRVEKGLDDDLKEVLNIYFIDTMTNSNDVLLLVNADSLKVSYTNGKQAMVENMFHFDTQDSGEEQEE